MRRLRSENGVVLISVILMGVVVSLLVVGLLDAVADELRMLQFTKDFLRARYAADAGVSVMLALMAEGREEEITSVARSIHVGGGTATFRRLAAKTSTLEYQATGRVGNGLVTVQLVVDREVPHRVRVWAVQP